jgi:hypothetical protein
VDASGSAPATVPHPRRRELRALAEGKRYEAYVEQQTAEMRLCAFCQKVYYRRTPMKQIGARWVCIDCLKSLKETLDTLDRWEELSALHASMERGVRDELKR